MNILVVDDDISVVELVSKQLRSHGHSSVTAKNGEIALEYFLKEPVAFDMIISDVMMPVMDGLELLEKIRQHKYDTPFIVMTGFGEIETVIKALKQGATDFLRKPYGLKELSSALYRIESMLNTKQSIEQTLPFINTDFHTSMPSKTGLISGVVGFLQIVAKPYCQLYGINSADITTSLTEALNNSVVHGNLDIPSELKNRSWQEFQELLEERESIPEYCEQLVKVSFTVINMQMKWEIIDNGKGFDYTNLPKTNDPSKFLLSGRGLFLIRSFMDKVSWNSKGNAIQMVKYLQKR
ncbi:MAG: response regulator [Desulfamplus sp.]|nr:response regulator [Desulfamplus sp.]